MEIKVYNKREVYLEGFGFIEISESNDGTWNIDFFPRGTENDEKKARICVDPAHGDKTFTYINHMRAVLKD